VVSLGEEVVHKPVLNKSKKNLKVTIQAVYLGCYGISPPNNQLPNSCFMKNGTLSWQSNVNSESPSSH
jgi:hypothetical protein